MWCGPERAVPSEKNMNPFGMAAGEIPEDVMDRQYDVATVFKNFADTSGMKPERRVGHGAKGDFVVEVRKPRRSGRDA